MWLLLMSSNRCWTRAVGYSAFRPIFMVALFARATSSMISTNSSTCSRLAALVIRPYSICSRISFRFSVTSFLPSAVVAGTGGLGGRIEWIFDPWVLDFFILVFFIFNSGRFSASGSTISGKPVYGESVSGGTVSGVSVSGSGSSGSSGTGGFVSWGFS